MLWPRRLVLCILALSLLSAGRSWAAGPHRGESRDGDEVAGQSDDPAGRARWFLRGRLAPAGQSSALLRLRAHRQRQAMERKQADMARAAAAQVSTNSVASGGQFSQPVWQSLGPAPLVSDPTFNFQDY